MSTDLTEYLALKSRIRELEKKVRALQKRLRQAGLNTATVKRNPKARLEIYRLIKKGYRNCEIERMGYAKSTIKSVKKQMKPD